jgi:hypothetical protein
MHFDQSTVLAHREQASAAGNRRVDAGRPGITTETHHEDR